MTRFKLNGKSVMSESPGDTPLLWVIRDEFRQKGTKFGCGIGMCGACTVHIDGNAGRSCVTPLASVAGSEVLTIEGLESGIARHLKAAWIDQQVPQCGYCQSGQVMQAESLLASNLDPTDEEIANAMNGNLCRCMAYSRIRKAIKLAASQARES